MFLLGSCAPPTSRNDFVKALAGGLSKFTSLGTDAIAAEGDFPSLTSLRIDLSGTSIHSIPKVGQGKEPAGAPVRIEKFEVDATPLRLETSPVDFHLVADKAEFSFTRDAHGDLVMALQTAKNAAVDVELHRRELEAIVHSFAKAAAAKQNVSVERTVVTVEPLGERSVSFEAEITARKFVSAVICIKGRLDIDERLDALLSGLSCSGDGMVGSLACGLIKPHLDRFDGRALSLAAFPLGDLQLRDVQLTTGERLHLHARLAS